MSMPDRLELLLGCGHRRDKFLGQPDRPLEWEGLVTLDINRRSNPDIVCDLNEYGPLNHWCLNDWKQKGEHGVVIGALLQGFAEPVSFKPNLFDEVHAYEVVEHLGQQGDHRAFFNFFSEVYRILKPGGYFYTTSPSRYSPWLWGDPSHRRVFIPESTVFLSQAEYIKQCDGKYKTPMTDFREIYAADFDVLDKVDNQRQFICRMQAVKPSRWVKPQGEF